jgi:hypothetical protein
MCKPCFFWQGMIKSMIYKVFYKKKPALFFAGLEKIYLSKILFNAINHL